MEVKINPFNMEKTKTIKDTFDLGKLDWAIVLITIEPERHLLEEEVMSKIKDSLAPVLPSLLQP